MRIDGGDLHQLMSLLLAPDLNHGGNTNFQGAQQPLAEARKAGKEQLSGDMRAVERPPGPCASQALDVIAVHMLHEGHKIL